MSSGKAFWDRVLLAAKLMYTKSKAIRHNAGCFINQVIKFTVPLFFKEISLKEVV